MTTVFSVRRFPGGSYMYCNTPRAYGHRVPELNRRGGGMGAPQRIIILAKQTWQALSEFQLVVHWLCRLDTLQISSGSRKRRCLDCLAFARNVESCPWMAYTWQAETLRSPISSCYSPPGCLVHVRHDTAAPCCDLRTIHCGSCFSLHLSCARD